MHSISKSILGAPYFIPQETILGVFKGCTADVPLWILMYLAYPENMLLVSLDMMLAERYFVVSMVVMTIWQTGNKTKHAQL